MTKKTKSKIDSYTLLPNGIWLESDQNSAICWHDQDDYLVYSEKKEISEYSKVPIFRAYYFLYEQMFGKFSTYRKIKSENKQIINTKSNRHSLFQKLSITKIIISLVAIYYFTSLQVFLQFHILQSFNSPFSDIISTTVQYILLILFLYLVFRLFIDSKDIKQYSKYNEAVKNKTKFFARNNTVFLIISVMLNFYFTSLVSNMFHINNSVLVFVTYPIVYEFLNRAEGNINNPFCFLIYYPVYFLDKHFTQKPTKKELKCITLALRDII